MSGAVENFRRTIENAKAIKGLDISNEKKGVLWEIQSGDASDKNPFTGALAKRGLAPDKAIEIMENYNRINKALDGYVKLDSYPSAAYLRTSYFKQWLTQNGYNAAQTTAIMDVFKYWQMIPAKISKKSEYYVAINPLG